jgi:hypothetical protein
VPLKGAAQPAAPYYPRFCARAGSPAPHPQGPAAPSSGIATPQTMQIPLSIFLDVKIYIGVEKHQILLITCRCTAPVVTVCVCVCVCVYVFFVRCGGGDSVGCVCVCVGGGTQARKGAGHPCFKGGDIWIAQDLCSINNVGNSWTDAPIPTHALRHAPPTLVMIALKAHRVQNTW